MPRALATFLATAVALFSASPALADPAAAGGEAEAPKAVPASDDTPEADGKVWDKPPKMRWYGEQTLLADAGSVVFLIAGAVASDGSSRAGHQAGDVLIGIGGAGYWLGAPIVHAAHGQWGGAAGSLGLRVGLPLGGALVGGLLGLAACGGSSGDSEIGCPGVGAAIGAVGGAIAAPFVDAFALAYEPGPRPSREAAVAPTFSFVRGGGSVGLVGQF
jgi:hypothetical protein